MVSIFIITLLVGKVNFAVLLGILMIIHDIVYWEFCDEKSPSRVAGAGCGVRDLSYSY